METVKLNNSWAIGYILEKMEPYHRRDSTIVDFVLDCENMDGTLSGRNLLVKAWDKLAIDVKDNFQVGDRVKVLVSLHSHRNKHNPALWYHVVTLREITKI